MKKKEEFAVGEEFGFGLVRLRCELGVNDMCDGCFFDDKNYSCGLVGSCCSETRSDGTDIIFVEVKSEDK